MEKKEAMKILKDFYDKSALFSVRTALDTVIPELKENKEDEDERIKNEIIAFVEQAIHRGGGTSIPQEQEDRWIAWLEAQDKKDNNEDAYILQRFSFYLYKDEPNVLYLSNVFVNEEYRNKGIGTEILKIADKVSTYLKCNSIRLKTENGSNAESLYRKNGYKTLKEEGNQIWLEKQAKVEESMREIEEKSKLFTEAHKGETSEEILAQMKGEQKPTAWSEEDEAKLKSILFHIEDVENKDVINWFKSIKDRVQPQNFIVTNKELAQAKKNAYNDALDKIEYHSGEPTFDDGWSAAIWYLKKRNTIPQSQWKPSDEQMAIFWDVICTLNHDGYKWINDMKSLYQDLKKLKEE